MCKGKRLEITNMHRISVSLELKGVHSSLAQYQLAVAKVNIVKDYRKEIFDNMRKYVRMNGEIGDIIIAGDYNQYIVDKEVWKFHDEIEVKEIHAHVNKIWLQ